MRIKHKFRTKYDPYCTPGEVNHGGTIVDPAGYLTTKDRVTMLIRSGERLEEYRREMYDYGEGLDEDDGVWIDPLRSPGIDLAEVSRLQSNALARLRDSTMRNQPNDEVTSEAQNTQVNEAEAREGGAQNGS